MINNPSIVHQLNEKIDAIANCLYCSSHENPSLMGGKTGDILFWAYYTQYKKNELYEERVTTILSEVFDDINNGFKSPTFSGGLAGIGWTVEHLVQNSFINADTNSIIGILDNFLFPHMLNYIQRGNYDYLHGALGIGMYYISRGSNLKTNSNLNRLVIELENQCTKMNHTIAWEKKINSDGDMSGYNLSMSHGIASIITILSHFYEADICRDKVSEIITKSVNFLLENKQGITSKYRYPGWAYKNSPKTKQEGRLAWCYYDMGIAIALWQVGVILNNEAWKKEAIDTLLQTTSITDLNESKTFDAGLCHGTAGVAHIYQRMFAYTKKDEFNQSATFWFEKSLQLASFSDGLAGFKTYHDPKFGGWKNDYTFLNGIAGIGLAMISAVSDIEPKWDRALLLS